MPKSKAKLTQEQKDEAERLKKEALAASAAVEFKEVYALDEIGEVLQNLVTKHLGTWSKVYDPQKSLEENLAKAAAVMPVCAQRIGSHTPKLRNSRVAVGTAAPFIARAGEGDDLPLSYMGGVDGKQNAGRMMLEKILFAGENRPKSLFDRIRDGRGMEDPLVSALLGHVDGSLQEEIIEACRSDEAPTDITYSTENFPIVYVPGEDFEDTLVTPLQAHSYFDTVENLRWREAKEDEGPEYVRPLRRDEVVQHVVVAKKDNIGTRRNTRTRVNTFLPAVVDAGRAELFRFIKGGYFPRLKDDRFDELMLRAAETFERTQGPEGYTNHNIRRGLQAMVEMMLRIAQGHIDLVVTMAEEEFDWEVDPDRLPEADDLLTGYRPRGIFGKDADRRKKMVLNFTSSEHMLRALKKAA